MLPVQLIPSRSGRLRCVLLLLLSAAVFAGCKKKEPEAVMTTVRGTVSHRYLGQPIANEKVSVIGYRRIIANFSSYIEEREAAVAYTDANGAFSMTYPDSIRSDSFMVIVPAFERNGRQAVRQGQDNVCAVEVYNQPILALELHIRNNDAPPMNVVPDVKLNGAQFGIYDRSYDVTRYWKADPETDYDFLFRFDETLPQGQRKFQFLSLRTGTYTDTFHSSLTVDATDFGNY